MKEEKLHIKDESRDKDFFTIVPNYILNHSTAIDQALYLQLKRLAGDGKKNYCYPSYRYLSKKLHLRTETIKKSLKYLIEHKWIDDLGKKQIMTAGGLQWVNAYKINNIWSLNFNYYKGASQIDPLSNKGASQIDPLSKVLPKSAKVLPKSAKVLPKSAKVLPVIPCKEERNNNVSKNYREIKQKFLKTCGKLFFRKKKKIENLIPQKKYKPLSDQKSEAFLKKAKEEMIKLCFPNSKLHQ